MVAGARRHELATLVTWHLAIYSTNTHQVSLRVLPCPPGRGNQPQGRGVNLPHLSGRAHKPGQGQAQRQVTVNGTGWGGGCWLRLVSVLSTSRGDLCLRTGHLGPRLPLGAAGGGALPPESRREERATSGRVPERRNMPSSSSLSQ